MTGRMVPVALTDAEREALQDAFWEGQQNADPDGFLFPAVERILTDRLAAAAVEPEALVVDMPTCDCACNCKTTKHHWASCPAQSPTPDALTAAKAEAWEHEWATRDDWYDESAEQSYGTESESASGKDYAALDAKRMGLTLLRRRVGPWEVIDRAAALGDQGGES